MNPQITNNALPRLSLAPAYWTKLGAAYCGDSLKLLSDLSDRSLNLVITSPPFALQRQKAYGNPDQRDYVDWLTGFGRLVYDKLAEDGSFVVDLGGAYLKGKPARSLHNFRALIKFCDELGFFLAEDFYWFNPSKLPSPIEWVNKRKCRAKDSVNTVWWFSRSHWPKSDVTRVLTEYSDRMKRLLADPEAFYAPKRRPSGHDISARFGIDNGGAIPSNLLSIPNTESNSGYLAACKKLDIGPHPARFPPRLPQFFIRLLTNPGDLVVDIFAGSNTTGMVAEAERRRWLSFDTSIDYVASSAFRFLPEGTTTHMVRDIYRQLKAGGQVDLAHFDVQAELFTAREQITRQPTVGRSDRGRRRVHARRTL